MAHPTALSSDRPLWSSIADSIPGVLMHAIAELTRLRISYCYWKSVRRLPEALRGEGDVDLLVARRDQHRTHAALTSAGFKRFPSAANREGPSIETYLGYDEATGRLIHVHLHFRLIVGEKMFANYRLPWEDELLSRATLHATALIPVLDSESEGVLLMARSALELRRIDPITVRRWRAAVQSFEADRKDIASRIDINAFRRTASVLMSSELAEPLLKGLLEDLSIERQGALHRLIRSHCATYRIYDGPEARARSVARLAISATFRINQTIVFAPRPMKRLSPGGGVIISILGVDGSGKSTAVSTLHAWLGSKVDVMPVYFGTGDGRPSLILRPFKWILPLAMRFRGPKQSASEGAERAKPRDKVKRLMALVWAVVVAMDKRKKLLAARRAAARGMVVITDRFPQSEIQDFNDGPLLKRYGIGPSWLRALEDEIYSLARKSPPDLVIKLIVTDQTAKQREPSMDPVVIRARIASLHRLQFSQSSVVQVDAEQPLEDVTRAIRRQVWMAL